MDANIQIRDEKNDLVGAGTTKYEGSPQWLDFERARAGDRPIEAFQILYEVAANEGGDANLVTSWLENWRTPQREREAISAIFGNAERCVASFDVSVPEARFYQVRIGTHDGPTYTREDLDRQSWRVELTIQ